MDSKKAYVKKRRKTAVFAAVVVLCFGFMLYFIPRAMKIIWKSDDIKKDTGSLNLLLNEVMFFGEYEDSKKKGHFEKPGRRKVKILSCVTLQKENSDSIRCKTGNNREIFLSEKDFFEKWSWGKSFSEKYNKKEKCSFVSFNGLKKLMIYDCFSFH
ncbi:MAG: hypothetical protein R6W70_02535 [bacterium]